jgi:hypothetical protein
MTDIRINLYDEREPSRCLSTKIDNITFLEDRYLLEAIVSGKTICITGDTLDEAIKRLSENIKKRIPTED